MTFGDNGDGVGGDVELLTASRDLISEFLRRLANVDLSLAINIARFILAQRGSAMDEQTRQNIQEIADVLGKLPDVDENVTIKEYLRLIREELGLIRLYTLREYTLRQSSFIQTYFSQRDNRSLMSLFDGWIVKEAYDCIATSQPPPLDPLSLEFTIYNSHTNNENYSFARYELYSIENDWNAFVVVYRDNLPIRPQYYLSFDFVERNQDGDVVREYSRTAYLDFAFLSLTQSMVPVFRAYGFDVPPPVEPNDTYYVSIKCWAYGEQGSLFYPSDELVFYFVQRPL